ncbi:MAG: FAD-dependent oxidoreductase [Aeromicrobium sp.]
MTYVITQSCCNDTACVPVCPVNCIHPTPDEPGYATAEMLYIDPDSCIDCGACVDVCPVSAITADYELPEELLPFQDLNAQYFRDPAHQGYDVTPSKRPTARWTAPPEQTLRVAVVGSGPAASFAADELLSQRGLAVEVDMFERLTTPWGLVRFGVAPDHQTTKSAAETFVRMSRRKGFRMFLNTEVGTDIGHDELRQRYHAVIYAVGAPGDRGLGIAGEHLPGSHSAKEFVAWYNGHPDHVDDHFDLSGERAVVIGNGNVALDVARVLLADEASLRRTDIADHALGQIVQSSIREVVVVGRRGPAQAAFTTPELLGLQQVPGLSVVVKPEEVEVDPATMRVLAAKPESLALYKAARLAELDAEVPSSGPRIVMRFLRSPTEILGDDHVEGVRLVRNELVDDEHGGLVAVAGTEVEEIECGLVLRSVGYKGSPVPGLPFDADRGVLPHLRGRVTDPRSAGVVPGVYASGWIKRGPTGVIGTNKLDAIETVDSLLEDWTSGALTAPTVTSDVAEILPHHVDLGGWRAIDAHERATGKSVRRPRVKVVRLEEQLEIARGGAS